MDRVRVFLRKYYRGIGSAKAKRLESLLERAEWDLLQKETATPNLYRYAGSFKWDSAACDIARKLLLPGDAARRFGKAVETFWSSEHQCARTNARLYRYVTNSSLEPNDIAVADFIGRWRKEIRTVLGSLPSQLTPRFSGGSTLSDKGSGVTIPDKLSSVPTVYAGSEDIVRHSVSGTILDRGAFTPVRSNRFFTVPKDSEKDRGCCVEASLAVCLQLDIDRFIKRRYEQAYKVSVDALPDKHRLMARLASVNRDYATIDLSNASDTVSRGLVKLLLPDLWYELLNSLRAKSTLVEGKVVYLEKFSSMGNGFTFMLETLLFQTLARTLGSRNGSTFGDDIVIETNIAPAMLAALRFFGFTPNQKKTFCEGPFRESCGGDFFDGEAVRPHYLKSLPSEPQHWVALANGIRRVDPKLTRLRAAWRYCVDSVPSSWRNFCSDMSLGDACFYDPTAQPRLRSTPNGLVPFWRISVAVSRTANRNRYTHDVQIASAVLGVPERIPLRGDVSGYRHDWLIAWGTNWLPTS